MRLLRDTAQAYGVEQIIDSLLCSTVVRPAATIHSESLLDCRTDRRAPRAIGRSLRMVTIRRLAAQAALAGIMYLLSARRPDSGQAPWADQIKLMTLRSSRLQQAVGGGV